MSLSQQLANSDANPLSLLGNSHNNNNNTNSHDDSVTITDSQLHSTADSTPIALLEQLIYVENNFGTSVGNQFDNNDLSIFADESFIFPDEDKPISNLNAGGGGDDDDEDGDEGEEDDDEDEDEDDEDKNEGNSNNLFQQFANIQSGKIHNNKNGALQDGKLDRKDVISESLIALLSSQSSNGTNPLINTVAKSLLANLPKCQVPQGAKISLSAAGLSDIQIDALAALIHQQQKLQNISGGDNDKHNQEFVNDLFFTNYLNNTQHHNQFDDDKNDKNFQYISPSSEFTPLTNNDSIDPLLSNNNIHNNHHQQQQQQQHQRAFSLDSITSSIEAYQSPGSDQSSLYNGTTTGGGGDSNNSNTNNIGDHVKRRRNTAASARFRVRKRMREQEMSKSIQMLNENASNMQLRIRELELENKVLRNLIIGKEND